MEAGRYSNRALSQANSATVSPEPGQPAMEVETQAQRVAAHAAAVEREAQIRMMLSRFGAGIFPESMIREMGSFLEPDDDFADPMTLPASYVFTVTMVLITDSKVVETRQLGIHRTLRTANDHAFDYFYELCADEIRARLDGDMPIKRRTKLMIGQPGHFCEISEVGTLTLAYNYPLPVQKEYRVTVTKQRLMEDAPPLEEIWEHQWC